MKKILVVGLSLLGVAAVVSSLYCKCKNGRCFCCEDKCDSKCNEKCGCCEPKDSSSIFHHPA